MCFVLTGCDTTSYPFNKGKKSFVDIALKNINSFHQLSEFGLDEWVVIDDALAEARHLFSLMYGRSDIRNMNEFRQHVFARSKSDLRSLPPTEDAFLLHVKRCLLQIGVYHTAYKCQPNCPPATEFGWREDRGILVPVMMSLPSKPKNVKKHFCKCIKSKCTRNCTCEKIMHNVICGAIVLAFRENVADFQCLIVTMTTE